MPASYPGTVKAFGPDPVDQVDTIYAAHIAALRAEVVAIQSILGVNPQGPAATVSARIAANETGFVTTTTNQTVAGNKTFTGTATFDATVRTTSTAGIGTIAGTTHPWQVGPSTNYNLAFDGRRLQARNSGVAADLLLQPYGGNAYVGAGKIWTANNDGPASGLDADTLDGQQATAFATASHQHPANFAQVYRNTSQSIPNEAWTTVVFNAVTVHYKESGSDMFRTSTIDRFYTPPAVGPALYHLSFRASFPSGSSSGVRRIRFLSSTGTVIDEALEEAANSSRDYISLSSLYYFPGTSGFYVQVQVYQDSGSSKSLQAHTSSNPFVANWAALLRGQG